MGFFGKIKQMLGIGGVKVLCQPSAATFNRNGGSLNGTIQLTTKNDQEILSVAVKVIEIIRRKEGETHKTDEYILGTAEVSGPFTLKAGQTQQLQFQVAYAGGRSLTDKMQAKGGVVGVMGKLGAMAAQEKSEYCLRALAPAKGRMGAAHHDTKLMPV